MGRWVRIASAVALLSGVVAIGGPAGAQEPEGCSQPYPPVWGPDRAMPDLDVSQGLTQNAGASDALNLNGSVRLPTGPPSNEIVVERPSGELRITSAVEVLAYSVGDLDGDLDEEIWVSTHGVEPARSWIVPYSTPDGTVDVTDAGIEVPAGVPLLRLRTGSGENPVTTSVQGAPSGPDNGTTRVLDGAAILAVGAGGDATGIPPIGVYPDNAPFAIVYFAGGRELVLQRLVLGPQQRIEYSSFAEDGSVTVFTAEAPLRNDGNRSTLLSPAAQTLEGPSGRYLQVMSWGFEDTRYNYLWSYDDPCTSLEVAAAPTPTPTTAPPGAAALSLTG